MRDTESIRDTEQDRQTNRHTETQYFALSLPGSASRWGSFVLCTSSPLDPRVTVYALKWRLRAHGLCSPQGIVCITCRQHTTKHLTHCADPCHVSSSPTPEQTVHSMQCVEPRATLAVHQLLSRAYVTKHTKGC